MFRREREVTMRHFRAALAGLVLLAGPAAAEMPDPSDWPAVLQDARGETVYFHAWGGEPRINDYYQPALIRTHASMVDRCPGSPCWSDCADAAHEF